MIDRQSVYSIRTGTMTDAEVVRAYRKKQPRSGEDHPLVDCHGNPLNSRFSRKLLRPRFAFPQPSFIDVLGVNTVAGTSFGTFTTAKTVIPTNSLCIVPAGYWTVGRYLEVDVFGGIGTLVTTPGTITFQVMLGSIIVFTTGAIQLNATAHTNLPFWFHALLTCQAVGSGTSAKFMGQAVVHGAMFTVTAAQVDGVNTMTTMMAPATAAAQGTGFDSTASTTLDFFVGFSISDAANTVKVEMYSAKSWN